MGNRPLLPTRDPLDEATLSTIEAVRDAVARGDWLDVAQAIMLPESEPAFCESARAGSAK